LGFAKPPLEIGGGDAGVTSDMHGGRYLMNVTEEMFAGNQIYGQTAVKK
jgi:hypothetical protein